MWDVSYLRLASGIMEKSDLILFIFQLQVDKSMERLANAFKYQKVLLYTCYLSDIFLMKKHSNCRMTFVNLYSLLKIKYIIFSFNII